MGKEVAVRGNNVGGLLAAFSEGNNPFLDAAAGSDEFFGAFLKFNGNTGEFSYGEKEEELDVGSELLVNMATAQHGWICWVDSEVEDERNQLIASGERFPTEDELPDHGPYQKYDDGSEDGWQEQYILHFFSEKLDQAFTYKTSSKSGIRSVRKLLKAYGGKAPQKIGEDGQIQVPLVAIDCDEFTLKNNKKAGKKYAPIFEIVDWVEFSEVADCFENSADNGEDKDDYADEAEAAPVKAEKPARGAAKDDEKPARGSRRAAPVEEDDQDGGGADTAEAEEEQQEPAEAPAGRRARVRHAPPQDEEETTKEDERTATGRDSARGRRGRSRG